MFGFCKTSSPKIESQAVKLFNNRLALAFLFGLDCWSTELESFFFLLRLLIFDEDSVPD